MLSSFFVVKKVLETLKVEELLFKIETKAFKWIALSLGNNSNAKITNIT